MMDGSNCAQGQNHFTALLQMHMLRTHYLVISTIKCMMSQFLVFSVALMKEKNKHIIGIAIKHEPLSYGVRDITSLPKITSAW
jgi:hypothetical protein